MFHTPSGRSNQLHGITPDFEVYRVPDPTEAQKFAVREGDRFPNAVPNPQRPFEQNRPDQVKAIEACLASRARARAVFEGRSTSELPLDHQLLHAADVLRCLRELK